MSIIDKFQEIASQPKFKGWPLVGEVQEGEKIPFFGRTINYQLQTPNGVEDYTSILRWFGWAVVFGVTMDYQVITLVQWKPGVNKASWELPPGGCKGIKPGMSRDEIMSAVQAAYLKETGYQTRSEYWEDLGFVEIETGKYRGETPNDHGLKAHLFLVPYLEQVAEARQPEANEIMETLLVPVDDFEMVLESNLFVETSAVACAYKALRRLRMFE